MGYGLTSINLAVKSLPLADFPIFRSTTITFGPIDCKIALFSPTSIAASILTFGSFRFSSVLPTTSYQLRSRSCAAL